MAYAVLALGGGGLRQVFYSNLKGTLSLSSEVRWFGNDELPMADTRSHHEDTGELPSLLRKLMVVISNIPKPQGMPNKPFCPLPKTSVIAQTWSDSLNLPLLLSCWNFYFVLRSAKLRVVEILLLQHPKS